MSKPLVSIILPVYNAQNHIARCLESICAQSWQNIEVIVLNDGSKDQSLPMCEAFRAKDERITPRSSCSFSSTCSGLVAPAGITIL